MTKNAAHCQNWTTAANRNDPNKLFYLGDIRGDPAQSCQGTPWKWTQRGAPERVVHPLHYHGVTTGAGRGQSDTCELFKHSQSHENMWPLTNKHVCVHITWRDRKGVPSCTTLKEDAQKHNIRTCTEFMLSSVLNPTWHKEVTWRLSW